MKKWIVILLIVGVVSSLFVLSAFAETNKKLSPGQQKEVDQLLEQEYAIRAQIVDKYVESGTISKELGKDIKTKLKAELEQGSFVPGNVGGGCGVQASGGCNAGATSPTVYSPVGNTI